MNLSPEMARLGTVTRPIQPRRPKTAAERMRKMRNAAAEIGDDFNRAVDQIDWARRRRCLADPRQFIEEYMLADDGGIFKYSPFAETDAILSAMVASAAAGIPYHIRMSRGSGKTTLMVFLAVYLLCRHDKEFIVLTGAKIDMARPMLADIWSIFQDSDKLAQDFPEYALPISMLGGNLQRAPSQRFLGEPTMIKSSGNIIRMPRLGRGCPLLGSIGKGAIVMANGFEGKTRGMRIGSRRPDFVLLDDIDDDEMATSQERVEKARQKIYKTYMKLGGSTVKPSMLMTSTAIEPGDLSETIAADPNWHTETFPMMLSMPDAAAMPLWKEYKRLVDLSVGSLAANDAGKFYLEHREQMDAGARPFWKECYDHETEHSAVEHAMRLYLEDEESFASECQIKPRRSTSALDLPRGTVMARQFRGYGRGSLPPGFVFVAAATDINPSYALTTTIVAFKPDRTAFVSEWIITPIAIDSSLNDTAFEAAVYDVLAAHGRELSKREYINAWGIDAGGHQFKAVTAFATNRKSVGVTIPVCGMLGKSQTQLNLFSRSKLADPINGTVLCGNDAAHKADSAAAAGDMPRRWMFWDADLYKETAQRSFLTETGAAGGCSLYEAETSTEHVDFAVQFTNERLESTRRRADNRLEYKWKSMDPHDILDTMAMCYAIAASKGYTGGISRMAPVAVAPRQKRRMKYVHRG